MNYDDGKTGSNDIRERVKVMITDATMTTGMWKELMRKMVSERPETAEWLYEALSQLSAPHPSPSAEGETISVPTEGAESHTSNAVEGDDPLHRELLERLDSIDEDALLSCHSNALWVLRLTMQMGSLEKALKAAEMDRSVFLRNVTEALGYDEAERFRINNYLRRYV